MPGALLWGWDNTNKVWIPLQVDANGYVKVDMSNINLDDLADVSVATPTDGHVLYWDNATSLWKGKGPILLPDLVRASNFIMISTVAGWTEVLTGAGYVMQEPMRQVIGINDPNAGSSLAWAAAFGFGIGHRYYYINWDKRLYILFNYDIYNTEAATTRRVQLQQNNVLGQLAYPGLGFQAVNLAMTGESYGTARGTVSLGNIVEDADPWYQSVQVVIELDPGVAVNFYINGALAGSITNTDHIPSGVQGSYFLHSIDRSVGGKVNVGSILLLGKIWQES